MSSQSPKDDFRFQQIYVPALHMSDEFIALAETLLFKVREYGISQFNPMELATPLSKDDALRFYSHVHDGWKQAQSLIAQELLDKLPQYEQALKLATKQHAQKNTTEKQKHLKQASSLGLEIAVLRRMLDVIPWTILNGEQSTIRRLQVKGGQNSFSVKNIADAMPTVDHFNESPYRMAVCNDMTSFIHIGDLLVVDMEANTRLLVELKAGKRNIEMTKAAAMAVATGCPTYEAAFKAELSPKDVAHFERTKRQHQRGQTVVSTINNEGGVDHNTGAIVSIHPSEIPTDDYADEIVNCWQQLTDDKHWAISSIDECLHVGVYNDLRLAQLGFNAWMNGMNCTSPIHSITDSFRQPMVRPFGSLNLPHELLVQVLKGKVFILLCFDILAFMNLGNEMQPGSFFLASSKESAEVKRQPYQFLEHDGKVLQHSTEDGVVSLGIGMQDRIVFDLHRPANLLAMHASSANAMAPETASSPPSPTSTA